MMGWVEASKMAHLSNQYWRVGVAEGFGLRLHNADVAWRSDADHFFLTTYPIRIHVLSFVSMLRPG